MELVTIHKDRQCLENVFLGKDVQIYNFVNAYGCSIDDGCKIGSFVEIQKGVTIGKNCKISSHSFICEGVHIADYVFIGHNVTFINDKFPRAINKDGSLQSEENWECIETFIEEGASIGSSATILCGVHVGKNAVVGAGSVVLQNIPQNTVYAGNPARFLKSVDQVII
ncbi:acyltransferase [Pedobacter immunditicola]|uniref:acyltransferase n=1 Tax=Pedobacter immunditicola TaxID=3133440 RepID=UPI003096BE1E